MCWGFINSQLDTKEKEKFSQTQLRNLVSYANDSYVYGCTVRQPNTIKLTLFRKTTKTSP